MSNTRNCQVGSAEAFTFHSSVNLTDCHFLISEIWYSIHWLRLDNGFHGVDKLILCSVTSINCAPSAELQHHMITPKSVVNDVKSALQRSNPGHAHPKIGERHYHDINPLQIYPAIQKNPSPTSPSVTSGLTRGLKESVYIINIM